MQCDLLLEFVMTGSYSPVVVEAIWLAQHDRGKSLPEGEKGMKKYAPVLDVPSSLFRGCLSEVESTQRPGRKGPVLEVVSFLLGGQR